MANANQHELGVRLPLRLLHLSDIHFLGYGEGWDLDEDQRNELLRDVGRLVSSGGDIDGVLVGGDIAYRAATDEFKEAHSWLDQVRLACGGIDAGRVWTVPGNHDVDRSVVGESAVLRQFRSDVRQCDLNTLDHTLDQRLGKDPAADAVMLPFKAYNEFASVYNCQVSSYQPHWFDDTLAFDGLAVRLHGLNTVVISDGNDSATEEATRLVLGTRQCQLTRHDGMIHIVIAHHPPHWIRDWNNVESYLRRATLLLFGHEHSFAAAQDVPLGTVVVNAGAVGPDRVGGPADGAYAPTYNLLTIARTGETTLEVVIEPRYWDHQGTCFAAHPDGILRFQVSVAQPPPANPGETTSTDAEPIDAAPPRSANPLAVENASQEPDPEAAESPRVLRRIGAEFMRMPWSRRVAVARELGVVEDHDLQLPDSDLFQLVLERIRERDLVPQLVQEMDNGRPPT